MAAAAAVALALAVFVNETLPAPALSGSPGSPAPSATASAALYRAARAAVLASGRFRSGEHPTSGLAQLLRLTDGSALLRLTAFRTSNGPAVHVWLSTAPAGSPSGVRYGGYASAVIWCERFTVTFGAAPLT